MMKIKMQKNIAVMFVENPDIAPRVATCIRELLKQCDRPRLRATEQGLEVIVTEVIDGTETVNKHGELAVATYLAKCAEAVKEKLAEYLRKSLPIYKAKVWDSEAVMADGVPVTGNCTNH